MKKIIFVILLGIISFCCKGQEVTKQDSCLVIDEDFYEYEKLDEMVNNDKINLILKPLYVIYNYDKHEKQIEPCSESDYLVFKKDRLECQIECQIGDNFLFNFSDDFKIDGSYMYSIYTKDNTCNNIDLYSEENLKDTLEHYDIDDYWFYFYNKDMKYKKHIINCKKESKNINLYHFDFGYDVVNKYIICYLMSESLDNNYRHKSKIALLFKKSDINLIDYYHFYF